MSGVIDALCERVRLRARRTTRFVEALWQDDAASPDQGLTIGPGEVRRHLLHPDDFARLRAEFQAGDEVCLALAAQIAEADRTLRDDSHWQRLVGSFTLSPIEADLLAAALALEVRPELARVYAYLADDVAAILPTLTLVRLLFEHDAPAGSAETGALRRWRLATPEPSPIAALAGWRADPAVAESLAAGRWRDPEMPPASVTLLPADFAAAAIELHPLAMARAAQRIAGEGVADLAGPRGSGRRTLAAQIARERGQLLLLVDTGRLLAASPDPAEAIVTALRMAQFEGAIACFAHAGAASNEHWRRVLPAQVPVVRCFEPDEAALAEAAAISLAPIGLSLRMALWRRLSSAEPPAAVTTARVTAGEIARIARGEDRRVTDEPAPELLTRLPTPYTWDDLVLPTETKAAITDFAQKVRLRGEVFEDWGFDRLSHLGTGLVALFAGPSGVGKTMAAQVLARELGLELFRIDLAGVVDKYIGETEKKLRAAFAFAERPGVLLMFDEADALFGSRVQAKDSHDRYANLEINYLLQRIETFEGIAVLATNRKSELDDAFRRRLGSMIDFLQPGPAERLELWKLALPERASRGMVIAEEIDHAMLANGLSLTGAHIKAAALGAAFLARAEGDTIRMRHVLAASQREMAKHGQAMRLALTEARTA